MCHCPAGVYIYLISMIIISNDRKCPGFAVSPKPDKLAGNSGTKYLLSCFSKEIISANLARTGGIKRDGKDRHIPVPAGTLKK